MTIEQANQNPFDFRTPIRARDLLVGRDQEQATLREHLESTAQGKPVHVALIGERASGKTSLLNIGAELAMEAGLVPVRLDCDAAVVSSPFTFFKAFFEATVDALVKSGALAANDPRYEAWLRQVHLGDTSIDVADQLLVFGMLAASSLHGATHTDITPALLKSDADRLVNIAREAGKLGLVLLIDEGDLIGQQAPLIQKLRNLFQASTRWMFVAAGTKRMFETLSDVFSPIPRQFVRIGVGPFTNYGQTAACIYEPLRKTGQLDKLRPNVQSIREIELITSGRPYEINLVCHFIWQALESGEQSHFALATGILDNVLRELADLGRETSIAEINAIRRLSEHEMHEASMVVPFVGYTEHEVALAHLFPSDFSANDYNSKLLKVTRVVDDLCERGILRRDGDRIEICGDQFVKVYYKYFSTLRLGEAARYRPPYAILLSGKVESRLQRALFGDTKGTSCYGHRRQREIGDPDIGRVLHQFCDALSIGDIARLADSPIAPFGGLLTFGDDPWDNPAQEIVFSGWVLSASVERVESGTLWFNQSDSPAAQVAEKARVVLQEMQPLLEKYGAELSDITVGNTTWDLMQDVMQFDSRHFVGTTIYELFMESKFEEALAQGGKVIRSMERHASRFEMTPRNQRMLADLHNRVGFILATVGDLDAAAQHYLRGQEISQEDDWLRRVNLASVRARQGDFAAATELCQQAMPTVSSPKADKWEYGVLLAYFPMEPPEFRDVPEWRIVRILQSDLIPFLNLQLAVYKASADWSQRERLRTKLANISSGLSEATDRLAAWASLHFFKDVRVAEAYLMAACERPEAGRFVTKELEYVRSVSGILEPRDEA